LADGIERILKMPEEQQSRMRQNCRRIAGEEYAVEVQVRKYQALFDAMLGKTRRGEGEGI
jgi:glycosyltransferase involved in cell wall biosynthesis